MKHFAEIDTPAGKLQLKMRIGIHSGRFLTADIGTPRRMEHVLLGTVVQKAKLTESNGMNERVNLSLKAYEQVKDQFRCDEGNPGYMLVVDDLTECRLGEYEMISTKRRTASSLLFSRNVTD